ncbi:MAG: Amuc_1100 family pilus-like protein [Chthoniobacterales bacterium]
MNWVKSNPFLTGLISVTLIITAALGYFLSAAYSDYTTVSEEYDARVGRLQQLQNRAPFPSEKNNQDFAALVGDYGVSYEALLAELTKMQLPLEEISPQAFQDRLRAVVSEVQAAAESKNITLPADFYLGFDQYQGTLPSDNAAGPLARQMAAIKSIVDRLISFRVAEISSIDRTPLPEENKGPAPLADDKMNRTGPGAAKTNEIPEIAQAFPFEISFVTEQGRLRQSLNSIVTNEQFFIIRNISVVNTELDGPSRVSEYEERSNSYPPPSSEVEEDAEPVEVKGLDVIVGREKLNVTVAVEMITFTPPTPTAQATPNP